jgi:glycine/D-amino acid oxidase-like deaminating enzyme
MEQNFDVIIVGGGIVGLATAYKLTLQLPNYKILVLEKEKEVAMHQTSHNSGVIHSGLYYKPGSYKAINCVKGRRELVEFAKQYKVPHDICGKIVVATDESELPHMHKVYNNGIANGVEDIELITPNQIKEIEPYCTGIAGIRVGCTGIIDYGDVAKMYASLINSSSSGSKVLTNQKVIGFEKDANGTKVITAKSQFYAKYIITTSGLQADRITKKEGANTDSAIVGFRGDYFDLTDKGLSKVKHLIYPVPNPKFPFLGVHFTRMIKGGVECGPNAVFVFDREGLRWRPGPLRAPPPRADHAVSPGAAACRELLRAHRGRRRAPLPRFVKDEFDAFLECGILAHGFLRLRCGECGHDKLLAFSCKRRGFCPSCGARRMSQTAAHLVDHVIPMCRCASGCCRCRSRCDCCWPRSPSWSRRCCRWCSA